MGLFDFFRSKPRNVGYSGGDGLSVETAVVIEATSSFVGVPAEYEYVTKIHGPKGAGWKLESQALVSRDGKHYDVLKITLSTGESKSYYFDITRFFGTF
jgi:hypothetical protein